MHKLTDSNVSHLVRVRVRVGVRVRVRVRVRVPVRVRVRVKVRPLVRKRSTQLTLLLYSLVSSPGLARYNSRVPKTQIRNIIKPNEVVCIRKRRENAPGRTKTGPILAQSGAVRGAGKSVTYDSFSRIARKRRAG